MMNYIKVVKIILAVLFIVSALLQLNDPDPLLWIFLYVFPAILLFIDIAGKNLRKVYLYVIIIYLIISLFYIPGVIDFFKQENLPAIANSMKAQQPWIEEAREFFGLIIIVLGLLWARSKNKKYIISARDE